MTSEAPPVPEPNPPASAVGQAPLRPDPSTPDTAANAASGAPPATENTPAPADPAAAAQQEPAADTESETAADAPAEAAADESSAEGSAAADSPRPAPVVPRRYLAGQTDWQQFRPRFPVWFRVFLLTLAAGLSAAALFALAMFPLGDDDEKPQLTCMIVDDYRSPDLAPLAWCREDAQRITHAAQTTLQAAPGSSEITRAYDTNDFADLFENRLRTITATTCIVYVNARTLSDAQTGYLLSADGSPLRPESGYSIDRMLQAIARSTTQHLLVVIDTGENPQDLTIGSLSNDFVPHLINRFQTFAEDDADEHAKPLRGRSVAILCACRGGEKRWSSPTMQGSPFAILLAYGLHGGHLADTASLAEGTAGEPDNQITARELAEFVRAGVSNWTAENRKASQTPVYLQYGPDFPLVDVDQTVTWDQIRSESLAQTPESETSEPEAAGATASDDTPAPAQAASGTPPAAGAAPPPATEPASSPAPQPVTSEPVANATDAESTAAAQTPGLSSEALLAAILDRWKQDAALASGPLGNQHAELRARLQQSLRLAERAVRNGNPERAQHLLESEADLLLTHRKQAEAASLLPDFFGPREESSPVPPELDPAIAQAIRSPGDEQLKAVATVDNLQARLLLLLADRLRQGETWSDPQIIRTAIETRKLATLPADIVQPEILPFVRNQFEDADRLRAQAELDLLHGRPTAATQGFSAAQSRYRQTIREAEELAKSWRLVQEVALAMPAVLRWLNGNHHRGPRWSNDCALVRTYLTELLEFGRSPTSDGLRNLAELAGNIRRRAARFAADALQPADWSQINAALELPLLTPELRGRLLQFALQPHDSATMKTSAPQIDSHESPHPLPVVLTEYLQLVAADGSTADPLTAELLQKLQKWEDRQRNQPQVSPEEKTGNAPDIRLLRAEASADLRRWILARQRRETPQVKPQSLWLDEIRRLVEIDWVIAQPVTGQSGPPSSGQFHQHAVREFRRFNFERLERDNQRLPGDAYQSQLVQFARDIKSHDDSFRWTPTPTYFRLLTEEDAAADKAAGRTVVLRLIVTRPLPPSASPMLLLQQSGEATDAAVFHLDDQAAVNGRLERRLDQTASHREFRYLLSLPPTATDPEFDPTTITASIRMGDGRIEWLPLALAPAGESTATESLVLRRGDELLTGPAPVVQLYPDQSFPLQLSVLPAAESGSTPAAAVGPLRVELLGRNMSRSLPVPAAKTPGAPSILTATKDFRIRFDGDRLVLQLMRGDEVLGVRELHASVLDPRQCFEPDVTFDPQTGKVIARVTRRHPSDVSSAVPMLMTRAGDQSPGGAFLQGNLATELKPDAGETVLSGRIPIDQPPPYRVALDISGVPRVFRFDLRRDRAAGQGVDSLGLSLAGSDPVVKLAWRSGPAGYRIPLHVDGGREIHCRVGIDLDQNGTLEDIEQQHSGEYWSGRDSQLDLVWNEKPPGFRVVSRVDDLTLPLDLTGTVGRSEAIIAAESGPEQAQTGLTIYVLKTSPPVKVLWPVAGSDIPAGGLQRVTIQGEADTSQAVDGVTFGLDLNANGVLEPNEALAPQEALSGAEPPFANSSRLTVTLPIPKTVSGPLELLVQTRTRVIADPATMEMQELLSEPARHPVHAARVGRVTGRVLTIDGRPQPGVSVGIAGMPFQKSDAQGRYTFENVPEGTHQVVAATRRRAGRAAVAVKAAGTTVADITIIIR